MYRFSFLLFLSLLISMNLFAQADEQKFNLARSYEEGGDIVSALRLYEEVYKSNKSEKYFEPIVRIYKQQNRFADLKPFVDERLKTNLTPQLLMISGELNWRLGNLDEANSNWNKCLKDFGKDEKIYIDLSQTLNSLRLFDKSINVLLEAKQKFPKNITVIDNLIRIYSAVGNYQDGFKEIIYHLQQTNDLQAAQAKLFGFMNSEESNDFIDKAFNRELKSNDNISLLIFYTWYLRAIKNFEKSLEITQKVDQIRNRKGADLYSFAISACSDGQYDIALKAFKVIIDMGKDTPYLNSSIYYYTKTMEDKLFTTNSVSTITKEEASNIIKSYQNIIKNYPLTEYSEQSKLRVAYLERTVMKNNSKAIEMFQDVINTKLNVLYTLQAMNELIAIYLSNGNIEKSNEIITTVQKQFATNTSSPEIVNEVNKAKFMQAEILYYSGKTDSALTVYKSLSKVLDDDIANDALEKIAFIEQNKDFVKALSLFAQAEYLELQSKHNDALKIFYEIINIGAGEKIGEKSIIKAAEIEFNLNNIEKSIKLLTDYTANNVFPIYGDNALFLLGEIAEKSQKTNEAIDFYTDILVKYPRSILINETRRRIRSLRNEF